MAASFGIMELPAGVEWLGSPRVIALLSLASAIEIAGYLIPWFDNLLDSLATPAAIVAGVLLSSLLLGDFDPLTRWTVAVIAGGAGSGAIQTSTATVRLLSSTSTGGLANVIIAIAELCLAVIVTVGALLLPALVLAATLFLVLTTAAFVLRKRPRIFR